jgi:maltose alpha-D-glucosyltransferase/alpha-amylase
VEHQTDAWQHALDVVRRYFERALGWDVDGARLGQIPSLWSAPIPEKARATVGGYLETAAMLGRRTADLHRVLAGSEAQEHLGSQALDEAGRAALRNGLMGEANRLRSVLGALPEGTTADAAALADTMTARHDDLVKAIDKAVGSLPSGLLLTRIHGDFHLGQVLLHEEDAYIVDFEGEPTRSIEERRRLQSPFKDVAGMVRSFCYAAGAGLALYPGVTGAELDRLKAWARWWQTWSISSYLAAYRGTAKGARFLPEDPAVLDGLLRVFLLEKTMYEALYEAAHRPSWLAIPLTGLLDLIGDDPNRPAPLPDDGLEG